MLSGIKIKKKLQNNRVDQFSFWETNIMDVINI